MANTDPNIHDADDQSPTDSSAKTPQTNASDATLDGAEKDVPDPSNEDLTEKSKAELAGEDFLNGEPPSAEDPFTEPESVTEDDAATRETALYDDPVTEAFEDFDDDDWAEPEEAASSNPQVVFLERLFDRAGIRADIGYRLALELSEDKTFMERLVEGLMQTGVFQPRGEIYERITLDNIRGLELLQSFRNQLERKRLSASTPEQWNRLGRLFAYAGEHERAALCYRSGFGIMNEATPELLVSIAEAVDPNVNKSLALGCIDRIAEIVLTGDQALDSPDRHDLTNDDPAGCAVLLDRSCLAAIRCQEPGRAASLARAATALFERCGLRNRLQRSLENLTEALIELGDLEGSLRTLERRRIVLSSESDYDGVADCYHRMAELAEALGNTDAASRYYDLEIQVWESIDEMAHASDAARSLGLLLQRHSLLDDAVDAYERARSLADSDSLEEALALAALAWAWEAMGDLSAANQTIELAVKLFTELHEQAYIARFTLDWALLKIQVGRFEQADQLVQQAVQLDSRLLAHARAKTARALLALQRNQPAQALSFTQEALHQLVTAEEEEEQARVLLLVGSNLLSQVDHKELEWLQPVLETLKTLPPEFESRLSVLAARLNNDREALQQLFDKAASSDLTFLRLEAAECLTDLSLKQEVASTTSRCIASALRTLGDIEKRLHEPDRESFKDSLLVQRLHELANRARSSLSRQQESDVLDGDSTAKLSPTFVIDGLLCSLGLTQPGDAAKRRAQSESASSQSAEA